ncbi:acetyl-CoA synthetase-like protein [Penicillium longicatenatum]|nr:acetyl-CoA synthetase-like protein [Penicillium longicatenatum]
MQFFDIFRQNTSLTSRQELDLSIFQALLTKESVEARFQPQLLVQEIVTAAWFLLLARYAQADSLDIQSLRINQLDIQSTFSIYSLDTHTRLKSVVNQASTLSEAEVCVTESTVHSFPLAERYAAKFDDIFRTAIVTAPHDISAIDSKLLAHISSCHIIVRCNPDRISLWVDPRVVDISLPRRLLSQLEYIAQQLVQLSSSPLRIGDLDYFSPEDQLDAERNDPNLKPAITSLLHEVIASFAKSRPNAPAICAWDGDFTYQELDELSTKLASKLIYAGVRPGALVPLLFEKSAYTHVAQIAVLKAGGAFTTLPYDMPLTRVNAIVTQLASQGSSGMPAVGLCSPSLIATLEPLVSHIIPVDETYVNEIVESSIANPPDVKTEDPAYVIFTSGTTGVPKGVIVEHRNICSSCHYFGGDQMALGLPGVRQSQFLSYAFDGSIHEIFYTLANGGCLCILSEDERMNDISGAMTRMGVTHAKFTPSIVDQLSPEDFPTVQKLFLGGEPLTTACIDRWQPRVEVWNNYGPAECTVQSTVICCSDPNWATGVIGHAGASRCFVVDPTNPQRRVPRGFIGDILVEGPNVSRGYLNNPAQTSRAFIEGLSWASSGRFYQTGDLGYVDSHGLLTCKGRSDDQVKINGQRIELGEVETHLQLVLPGNSRGVVDAIKPSGRNNILIALVQVDESLTQSLVFETLESQIRESLAQALPPAFVPSRIVQVKEIPLGATGKTDRKALRKIAKDMISGLLQQQKSVSYAKNENNAPVVSEEKEKRLREMWAETLHLPTETIHSQSDFFDLGGSSLLAMRLTALARKQCWNLTVKDIFAHPVLGEMVKFVSPLSSANLGIAVKGPSFKIPSQLKSEIAIDWKIDGSIVQDIYPATTMQETFLALATANQGAYIMQYTFTIPHGVDVQRVQESWKRVMQAHPILRTRFYNTASGLFQVVLVDDFHWEERCEPDSTELRKRIKSSLLMPCQPLSQLHLLTDKEIGTQTLLWTVSHALTDGWTSSRLFSEIYSVYARGIAVPPTTPYTSFVQASMEAPKDMDMFWKSQIDHGPVMEYPILPYANFRPETNSRQAGQLSIAHRSSTSTYTVPLMIRAAWAITISEMTHRENVLFGVNLSGRHEFPDVVGPTVTTVPLRTTASGSLTIEEFLNQLRDQSVRTMPFEQTGMQRIANIDNRSLQAYCKFQSSLVVQLPREQVIGDISLDWMHPTRLDTVSAHGLVVNCLVESSEINVWMNYDNRVLGTESMQNLMSRFLAILSQVLAMEENQTISQIRTKNHDLHLSTSLQPHTRIIEYLGQNIDASRVEKQMAAIVGIPRHSCRLEMIRPNERSNYQVLAAFIFMERLEKFEYQTANLQLQLGQHFPNYMIPSLYVPVSAHESLSLGSDYLEKSAWNHSSKPAAALLSTPLLTGLTAVEETLMKCWTDVLGRTNITINDSFLFLGGDSIKVMRLVSAARAANLRLSVAFAMQNPVFRQMAAGVEVIESQALQGVQAWSLVGGKESLSHISDEIEQQIGHCMEDLDDIFPVTGYQKSTFLDSLRTPGTCVLQTRYQLDNNVQFPRMRSAWRDVCMQFPCLRTRLVRADGWGILQAVVSEVEELQMMQFETIHHLQSHMQKVLLNMTCFGASLNRGIFAVVGEGEDQERYLIWSIHHAVFDGCTLQKVRKALVERYQGAISQKSSPLQDYVGFLQSQDPVASERYWTRYLKGADASAFPHYPTPEYVVRPHETHRLVLGLKRSGDLSITMATVIHAAWGMVLASLTGTSDATYQHLVSGRTAAVDNIDRFAGPTINLVPVRIKVEERLCATVRGFLAEIQAQSTERISFEGVGMDTIMSMRPEKVRLFDFHHMLVIHSDCEGEQDSEDPDSPIHKTEESMNLDGYLGLIVQCTISHFGVTVDLRWDESLLPLPVINTLCARMGFLLRALVEGDQSATVEDLRRQCHAL